MLAALVMTSTQALASADCQIKLHEAYDSTQTVTVVATDVGETIEAGDTTGVFVSDDSGGRVVSVVETPKQITHLVKLCSNK